MRPLVVVLVSDGFHPFEFGVACEVFGVDRSDLSPSWYRFAVAGEGRPRSSGGWSLGGLSPLTLASRAHTLVVPGWERLERPPSPRFLQTLQRAARRGARIISFCSGSFALAHAGLVRRATTHWMFAARFAACFPHVELDTAPLWVRDRNVWTAAGTAAAIDCGLAVIASDFGQRVAVQVARRMVAAPTRAGGQAQFIEQPMAPEHEVLEPARRQVLSKLAAPHPVAALARTVGMSPRSFARHFVATMGTTPHAWVLSQRLARARELLETRRASVDQIAEAVGMRAENLRQRFRTDLGLSPTAYRKAFAR